MPKQKAKPLWHDPGIEWFFVSAKPQSPAIHGGIENGRRIDRDDSAEIRRCLGAFRQALRTCEKPTRLAKRWADPNKCAVAREILSRDPAFFHLQDRSFWPTRIGYKVARPEQMSHHFGIDISHNLTKPDWNAENEFPGGMVASKELCQIVEELQPGYAKFFPVQLEFKDQLVEGYSWFVQPYRLYGWHPYDGGDYVHNDASDDRNKTVHVHRSKLTGVHWERVEDLKYFFSGVMARRLEPLILRREKRWLTGLVPVTVIEN